MHLNKLSLLTLAFCLLLATPRLHAQDTTHTNDDDATPASKPFVEYVNGGKRLNVSQLGFSPNMTVWELLQLLPELSTRGSLDVLNNYTIIMDDYSLGTHRDEVLYQMTIGELEAIVISDNPSMAYVNDGVGGSIELVRRTLHDGLSGNAQIDVSTEQNVLLSTTVNYKKEKWQIRSYLKGEYLNYLEHYDIKSLYGDDLINSFSYDSRSSSASEIAKFSINYTPTAKDEISFAIWETYGQQREETSYKNNNIQTGFNYDTTRTKGVGTFTHFQYAHNFSPHHTLTYNVDYQFIHQKADESYSEPHELTSGIHYQGALLQKGQHTLLLVTGADFSFDRMTYGKKPEPLTNSYHISPLLEFSYTLTNKLFARVGARYHYDKYEVCNSNSRRDCDDYTINGEINYTPAQGHTVRMSGARYRLANAAEKTGSVASGDISYIFQKTFEKDYLNVTAGFQYNHANLLNGTNYNIFVANAAIVWSNQWACLSLSSQIFDNATERNDLADYHLYYNLRLTPIFTLPKGWSISANFMYNSIIKSKFITYGDYFYASLRVGKHFKQWAIHLEFADPFHYKTDDKYFIQEEMTNSLVIVSQNYYYPYHRYLSLGVMYAF